MTFAPIAPTTTDAPTKIAHDTYVIHQVQPALGQPLFVYINSMVILGKEPVIVDTGTPAIRTTDARGWVAARAHRGQSVRMTVGRDTPFGLPEVPTLAEVVAAWGDAGHWAVAVDDQWRSLYLSDELASAARGQAVVGEFMFGAARVASSLAGKAGINTIEEIRAQFMLVGGWMLVDIGREALSEMVDPVFRDLVDGLEPCDDEARMMVSATGTPEFGWASFQPFWDEISESDPELLT